MKQLWKFKIDFIRRNPILSSYISFIKGVIITIILCSLLSSCGSYRYYSKQPQIQSFLAITSEGDTIQVSPEYLRHQFNENPGNYSNWRFYWNNSWYYGNGWFNYYDPYWMYRIPYQNRIIIQPRPRVSTPKYIPRHFDNRPETPLRRPNIDRGRSNNEPRVNPPRQPQQPPRVVQPRGNNQPRVNPPVRPTQPPRNTPPSRGNNNSERKPIKQ